MKYIFILALTLTSIFAKLDNFKSIESDFVQKITNDEKKTIVYEGKLYLRDDNKAFWQYTKPVQKQIFFNGNNVLMVEPELEQVVITKLDSTPDIGRMLKEAKEIGVGKYIAKYKDTTYTIEASSSKINKITYNDRLDNGVEIIFSNQNVNIILEDELFKAVIPKGYDIISQ
ncbi:MAG: LolA-like outer membrane lipoprotein chaperone [Sulfurospirillaceae bacterium]|nr:LolA-like outer membrane lipoprotein chaperone [Sulfurospirillaceae bacterium]